MLQAWTKPPKCGESFRVARACDAGHLLLLLCQLRQIFHLFLNELQADTKPRPPCCLCSYSAAKSLLSLLESCFPVYSGYETFDLTPCGRITSLDLAMTKAGSGTDCEKLAPVLSTYMRYVVLYIRHTLRSRSSNLRPPFVNILSKSHSLQAL